MKKLLILLMMIMVLSANAKLRIYKNVNVEDFPERLRTNLQYHDWENGFIDVTKAPYNAKGDGIADDTEAIQNAIDDAFECNLIVFFPSKNYLVSDQLTCIQKAGPDLPHNEIGEASQRKFGHLLLGSEKNGEWPTITLKDNSTVKDNLLFLFEYRSTEGTTDASRHYLGSIRNFNIDMGENPDISALSNDGAQHCVIENIRIKGNFDIGIKALPGSGGFASNITIEGGKIGIYQKNYRPNPTVFGIHLENQSECAIKITESRGAVTFAGFKIIGSTTNSDYNAVRLNNNKSGIIELGARANLNLIDGTIETFNGKPAINSYKQDVVIKNVFFKSEKIIEAGTAWSSPSQLNGDQSKWLSVAEYVYSSYEGKGSVYVNQINKRYNNNDCVYSSEIKEKEPPVDLLTKHLYGTMPSIEGELLNITDFGATRDDNSDDDAIAINNAISAIIDPQNENYQKILFIPRGHFHIQSTIQIKKGLKVLGAGKNISLIMVDNEWKPEAPVSAVVTEDIENSGIILSDFGLVLSFATPGLEANKNITLLEIKSGDVIVRDLQTNFRLEKYQDCVFNSSFIKMNGHASGKFYGLCLDYGTRGVADEKYHIVEVENCSKSLAFYQLSLEDASSPIEGEKRVHMDVKNCEELKIFGLKYEKQGEILHVNNTANLEIYGGSGNYSICDTNDTSMFRFENVPSIFMSNISRSPISEEVPDKNFIYDDGFLVTDDHPVSLYSKHDTLLSALTVKQYEFDISLMNNPVKESILMKVNNKKGTDIFRYALSSVNGTPVETGYLQNEGINSIQCGYLPSGIYILHVYLNEYSKSWKVLKV